MIFKVGVLLSWLHTFSLYNNMEVLSSIINDVKFSPNLALFSVSYLILYPFPMFPDNLSFLGTVDF